MYYLFQIVLISSNLQQFVKYYSYIFLFYLLFYYLKFRNQPFMIRKKILGADSHLQPIKVSKAEASYQALLLDMMSKLVSEQRESNRLLKKIAGEEKLGNSNSASKLSFVSSPKKQAKQTFHWSIPVGRSDTEYQQEQESHFQDNSKDYHNFSQISLSPQHFSHHHSPQPVVNNSKQDLIIKGLQGLGTILERIQLSLNKNSENVLNVHNTIREDNHIAFPNLEVCSPKRQVKIDKIEAKDESDEFNIFDKQNISRKKIDIAKLQVRMPRMKKNTQKIRHSMINTMEIQKMLESQDKPQNIALIPHRSNKDSEQRKNYSILSQILPYSDRRQIKIKISVNDIIQSYQFQQMTNAQLSKITEQWLGMVYRATASICWNMLSNHLLTFEETKILFTENIIFNFIQFMKSMKILGHEQHRFQLAETINQTSINILDFLCTQYPQTRIQDPNIALRAEIPSLDNKGRVKYDFIGKVCQNKIVLFRKKDSADYTQQIMRVINYMIQKTNEEFDDFNNMMAGMFGEIFLPIQKRRVTERGEETHQDQIYYQKVKNYTKFLVGRKINKNTPYYSQPEIQNGIFFVKSTSILRIVTKWVQQLDEMIRNPQSQIKNTQNEFKDHDGMPMHLYAQVKNGLYKQIKRNQSEFEERVRRIKKQCYNMQVLLTLQRFTTDPDQTHLSEQQISVGKYCTYLRSAISSYICSQLNEVIHFLLTIPSKVDQTKIGIIEPFFQEQSRKDLDNLNLINFKIFDLIRCKCISKQSQIVYLIKRLNQKSNDSSDPFKIVRIKDRLNKGTRDILVNAQIKKGLICEIQLAVTSNMDKKQELLDQYNHFLYELRRAKLGPITENASIWSALEQRATFFQTLINKQEKICMGQVPHPCVTDFAASQNRKVTKFPRPIICASCHNFFQIPKTCLLSIKCQGCSKTICGQCHYQHLNKQDKKEYIFQKLYFHSFYPYLTQYMDYDKPFPRFGFIIRKTYLKKQLLYYKIISKSNEDNENNCDDKQKQMDVELIQSVIQNGQLINKTINRLSIVAVLKNGQLFIQKNYRGQLESYIIFSIEVGQDIQMKTMTYKQILETFHKEKYKYINILRQPAYIEDLKIIKKAKLIKRQTASLKAILSLQTPLTFLKLNRTVILVQAQVQQKVLQSELVKILNISKLKSYALDKCNSVSMEFRHMTDQMDMIYNKFSPQLLASFSKRVTKLYLNFGQVKNINFLQMIVNIKVLFLRSNLIQSLSGVENLKSLVLICFDKNSVSSLQPLSALTQLTQLSGSQNKITSLSGIQNLIKLKKLVLYKNQIPKIEYTQKLSSIKQLSLNYNCLSAIEGISHMNDLQDLHLGKNVIENIQPLSVFTIGLKKLSLDGLKLKQIDVVFRNFDFLVKLCLSDNQITKIQNLDQMTELVQLNLKNNHITEIQNLQNCVKLQILKLHNNDITNVRGIRLIQNLKVLNLQNNPLQDCQDMYFVDKKSFKLLYSAPNQAINAQSQPTSEFYQRLQAVMCHKGNSSSSGSNSSSSSSESQD